MTILFGMSRLYPKLGRVPADSYDAVVSGQLKLSYHNVNCHFSLLS